MLECLRFSFATKKFLTAFRNENRVSKKLRTGEIYANGLCFLINLLVVNDHLPSVHNALGI